MFNGWVCCCWCSFICKIHTNSKGEKKRIQINQQLLYHLLGSLFWKYYTRIDSSLLDAKAQARTHAQNTHTHIGSLNGYEWRTLSPGVSVQYQKKKWLLFGISFGIHATAAVRVVVVPVLCMSFSSSFVALMDGKFSSP